MGYPRSHVVSPDMAGTYHCVSRCVRRAYLCGTDGRSGRCYDHRRHWLERRLLQLSDIFSVALLGYAVMENHLHVVVHVDPGAADTWSPEDIAARWLQAYRPRHMSSADVATAVEALAQDAKRIATLRTRLGSISWFMRALKEPIARAANQEDDCTGHFWEGRFRCQVLLDEAAVLACMAYVELNPVRTGQARTPMEAPCTSAARRVRSEVRPDSPLKPVAGAIAAEMPAFSVAQYHDLLRGVSTSYTAMERSEHSGPEVASIQSAVLTWRERIDDVGCRYRCAIGSTTALANRARELGQRWLVGMRRREGRASPPATRGWPWTPPWPAPSG